MIEPTNKNGYQGQKCGPFLLGENIALEILNTEAIENNLTIKHLGIQAPAGTIVEINEEIFIISKNNILELYTTSSENFISSIKFLKEDNSVEEFTLENIIIDYTIE